MGDEQHRRLLGSILVATDCSAGAHGALERTARLPLSETALKAANFLVIAHGTADEIATAKSILETTAMAQSLPIKGECGHVAEAHTVRGIVGLSA